MHKNFKNFQETISREQKKKMFTGKVSRYFAPLLAMASMSYAYHVHDSLSRKLVKVEELEKATKSQVNRMEETVGRVSQALSTLGSVSGNTPTTPRDTISSSEISGKGGEKTMTGVATSTATSLCSSDDIENLLQSVVNITVMEGDPSHRQIGHIGPFTFAVPPSISLGSGVVIDGVEGLIVTNAHVVSHPPNDQFISAFGNYKRAHNNSAKKISITLFDGRIFETECVLSDELNDLALLRIKKSKEKSNDILPSIEIGDPMTMKVGNSVLAIGSNPFGSNTVTDGIVSFIGRAQASNVEPVNPFVGMDDSNDVDEEGRVDIGKSLLGSSQNLPLSNNPYLPVFQTNASINQGNSGGALIDTKSKKLIGINTSIASPIGVNIGLAFAIPSSFILPLLHSYHSHEDHVVRPWDGLEVARLRLSQVHHDHLSNTVQGIAIVNIHDHSPFYKITNDIYPGLYIY
ncbi:putative serine protease, partial [Reticulomyxa filosa]